MRAFELPWHAAKREFERQYWCSLVDRIGSIKKAAPVACVSYYTARKICTKFRIRSRRVR